jgi:hypothetical protein
MTTLISPPWANWYWIVNDSNPAAKVYSTASGAYVNNNAAAFLAWLADTNFGAASGLGSGIAITAAANNGSGKTRLTVSTTATVASGQYFYFGANGAQQITVIDSTHIDLTGLAFSSYVPTAAMQGATIIDTDANLRKHLNTVALRSNTAGANMVSGAVADVTLTNPMALWQSISFALPGKKIILPPMNGPNSIPMGVPFFFESSVFGFGYDIYLNDGVTKLASVDANQGTTNLSERLVCELVDNSTANGTIKSMIIGFNTSASRAGNGVQAANNPVSPNTKMDISPYGTLLCVLTDTFGLPLAESGFSLTVDTGLAGPIANGRDSAAAFTPSRFLHFFVIYGRTVGGAGLVSGNPTNPTLPAGYTHFAYIFSSYFDGSGHLVPVHLVGDRVSYDGRQVALNSGAATVDTAVSVSTLVPTMAMDFDVNVESWGVTADGTGAAISVLHLGFLAGTDTHALVTDFSVGPITGTRLATGDITFPNVLQQFYYHHQVLNGSAPAATITVRSYRVPNGA